MEHKQSLHMQLKEVLQTARDSYQIIETNQYDSFFDDILRSLDKAEPSQTARIFEHNPEVVYPANFLVRKLTRYIHRFMFDNEEHQNYSNRFTAPIHLDVTSRNFDLVSVERGLNSSISFAKQALILLNDRTRNKNYQYFVVAADALIQQIHTVFYRTPEKNSTEYHQLVKAIVNNLSIIHENNGMKLEVENEFIIVFVVMLSYVLLWRLFPTGLNPKIYGELTGNTWLDKLVRYADANKTADEVMP